MKILKLFQDTAKFIQLNSIDVRYFSYFVAGVVCALLLNTMAFMFIIMSLFVIFAS
jgi:hypothetical protein